MKPQTWTFWLVGCLIVSSLTPAEAQRFRRRGSPRSIQDLLRRQRGSDANPRHERAKTEADRVYQQGDFERAARLTNMVLRENPRDHVALYLRASANIELGFRSRDGKLIRSAVADARNSIAHSNGSNVFYYIPYLYGMTNLAILEANKKHAEVAVTIGNQVLDLPQIKKDERAQIHYQRARAHSYLANYTQAVDDFEKTLQLDSNHLGAFVGLADVHAATGNVEKTQEAYSRAIGTFPDNPLVYNNRGMFLQQQGKPAEAIADFTRAIELDRRYHAAFTNRGFALMESGNPQAAEPDFDESLRLSRNQPMVYNLRGVARLAQGKVREAISDQREMVRQAPQDPVAHADLGFALFFSRDFANAERSFAQALEINAEMRHLIPWRAASMQRAGEAGKVSDLAASAVEKKAEDRDWIDQLLVFLVDASSEEELFKSVRTDDKYAKEAQLCEAHFFVGFRAKGTGNNEAAAIHFQKALDTGARYLSAYRGAQFALNKFSVAELKLPAAVRSR